MSNPPPKSSSKGDSALPAYRLPAEWEPHQGTWVAWPHNQDTWPAAIKRVEQFYVPLIQALLPCEEVHVLVNDHRMERYARRCLGLTSAANNLQFHHIVTDDAWCRDYGATLLRSVDTGHAMPARLAVVWGFNAWGGKYPPWENDNRAAARMAQVLEIPCLSGSMILEGGSIESNGQGTLMTTDTCLLNPNRNPELQRQEIESKLSRLLGAQRFIWLSGELAGDDTDGHIDQLARFLKPEGIATVTPGDKRDSNYPMLVKMIRQLETAASDYGLQLTYLPPPPRVERRGRTLPASYANFYIANELVLVPQFRVATDDDACAILASQFPGRKVIGLDCTDVIEGLGAIHCLTQQIPIG